MNVKVLSVQNPISYLICGGIKDIENRTWRTNYRGTIFIHSSGKYTTPDIISDDLPEELDDSIQKKLKKHLKKGDELTKEIFNKYDFQFNDMELRLLKLQFTASDYLNKTGNDFFTNRAIIGKVDLVDIIEDSKSIWSVYDNFHWVLENPVLFEKPLLFIKGRLGLWNYELTEDNYKLTGKQLVLK